MISNVVFEKEPIRSQNYEIKATNYNYLLLRFYKLIIHIQIINLVYSFWRPVVAAFQLCACLARGKALSPRHLPISICITTSATDAILSPYFKLLMETFIRSLTLPSSTISYPH